jgi:hypothetical protein
MSEATFRAALVKIARLWDATGDPVSNQAANIARKALIECDERRTLAPRTRCPTTTHDPPHGLR